MKARAAVNGFVAEGSTYETEKEIGRGKRKIKRNRLFHDSDSDEIKKYSKKSIPAPPSVPFKSIQRKIIHKPKQKGLLPKACSPPTEVSYMLLILKLI